MNHKMMVEMAIEAMEEEMGDFVDEETLEAIREEMMEDPEDE